MSLALTGLFLYPVKSLRGIAVPSTSVDTLGLVGDRRFLVVDDTGKMLTQRTTPRMALVSTALGVDALTLSAAGSGSLTVSRAGDPTAPLRSVAVWKSTGLQAEDCGDAAAAWLTAFLSTPCRLVRIGAAYQRAVGDRGDQVSFADGYPFLLTGEASLADLNHRLLARGAVPVPMDRFRANFVFSGGRPFAEDTWPRLRIGEVVFRAGGPCSRCIMTTTDQVTGERGKEPLRTLATFRRDARDPANVNFGQNLIHESKTGTLGIGDIVTPLS